MTADNSPSPTNSEATAVAKKILDALRGLRFGSVEITVHEGRIVQIERREKCRLNVTCPGTGDDPEDRGH